MYVCYQVLRSIYSLKERQLEGDGQKKGSIGESSTAAAVKGLIQSQLPSDLFSVTHFNLAKLGLGESN